MAVYLSPMPSPKLYFRCHPDLHARFTERCVTQQLSPSEGLKLAVEQWLSPSPVTQAEPVTQLERDPEWSAWREPDGVEPESDQDVEQLIALFTEQGIDVSNPSLGRP